MNVHCVNASIKAKTQKVRCYAVVFNLLIQVVVKMDVPLLQ